MGCCNSKSDRDNPQNKSSTTSHSFAESFSSFGAKPTTETQSQNFGKLQTQSQNIQDTNGKDGRSRGWAGLASDSDSDEDEVVEKPVVFLDHYKLGAQLGEGSGGVVYDAIQISTNILRAVKMCDRKSDRLHELDHEIEILTKMNNRNIVRFMEVFIDDSFTYVIMDKFSGGDLVDAATRLHDSHEGRVRERWLINIMRQICSAMEYLHEERELVHRDVKSDNFLVDRPDISDTKCHCVLADFGQCVYLKKKTVFAEYSRDKVVLVP